MTMFNFTRRAAIAASAALMIAGPGYAGGHQVVESIHFLIPGGAGGGWDGTARGTGEALTGAGLVGSASHASCLIRVRASGVPPVGGLAAAIAL